MNITLAQLDSLLYSAREEGLEAGLREAEINQQFANSTQNNQIYEPQPEALKPETTELPLPEDDNSDEEYWPGFGLYSDGFDDGYSEAIADVKESLEF